jgi:hypothetical protein
MDGFQKGKYILTLIKEETKPELTNIDEKN